MFCPYPLVLLSACLLVCLFVCLSAGLGKKTAEQISTKLGERMGREPRENSIQPEYPCRLIELHNKQKDG